MPRLSPGETASGIAEKRDACQSAVKNRIAAIETAARTPSLATPDMLEACQSMEAMRRWCNDGLESIDAKTGEIIKLRIAPISSMNTLKKYIRLEYAGGVEGFRRLCNQLVERAAEKTIQPGSRSDLRAKNRQLSEFCDDLLRQQVMASQQYLDLLRVVGAAAEFDSGLRSKLATHIRKFPHAQTHGLTLVSGGKDADPAADQ